MNDKDMETLKSLLSPYVIKTKEKSTQQQISEFFEKGNNGSFITDLNIVDWFNFFWDIEEVFNIEEHSRVVGSPTYGRRQSLLDSLMSWSSDLSIYIPEYGDLTMGDLDEAIKLGHWHFKFCDPKYMVSENKR